MTVTTAPEAPPSRRRRLRPLLLLLVLVVVAGGAYAVTNALAADTEDTHDHSSHSHEPDLNPCTLVTVAEVESVVGAVTEPTEGGIGVVEDQRVCTMNLEDSRFMVSIGFTDVNAASKYRGVAGRFPGVTEELSDLGDEAVWIDIFLLVVVRVDDGLLSVQMSDVHEEPAESRDKAVTIAGMAVDGFPNAERD